MAKKEKAAEKHGTIDAFFDALGTKSASTKSGYLTAIWQFIRFVYDLTDEDKPRMSTYADRYFAGSPDVVKDFKRFMQRKEFQERAPLGARQAYNQLKMFFDLSGHEITKRDLRVLLNQIPKGGKASEETHLTSEMINAMLQHADTKGRAIVMTLTSSGMRVGELTSIECSDVHFASAEIPAAWLYIRKPKNKLNRHTHISTEAAGALREWIKIRGAYLQENQNRGMGLKNRKETKSTDDNRLFPMSEQKIEELIANLVTKVNGENARCKTTGRSLIHPHMFRKFFMSRLTDAGMTSGVVKALAGQVTQLERIYIEMPPADTAKHFIAHEHALYVEAAAPIREAATNNTKKFEEHRERLDVNQALINSLMLKNERLNEKVLEQSTLIANMKESILQELKAEQQKRWLKYIAEHPECVVKNNLK